MRALQSLEEVRRASGDADPAAVRLKDDLATAVRNRDEAGRSARECEERVLAQRQDRTARADSRPVWELRAIAADERLEREAARVAADDARLQALLRDEPGRVLVPLFSAMYCVTGGARQPLADELVSLAPALKKKGKAGAAAKARAQELQPKIAQADALLEALRQDLAGLGPAVPCDDPAGDKLQECLAGKAGGEHRPECDDPANADAVAVWDHFGVGEKQATRYLTSL
jgi:hypothetical protein